MNKISEEEMITIEGGAVSGAIINYATRAFKFIYDLGRSLGSSIRRIGGNLYCPIK